jgi:hypothetical protein
MYYRSFQNHHVLQINEIIISDINFTRLYNIISNKVHLVFLQLSIMECSCGFLLNIATLTFCIILINGTTTNRGRY